MEDILKSVGARLRIHRRKQGMTQDEVADRTGVSQSYIGSVERGQQNLTVVNLVRIAQAVGVRMNELFIGNDNEDDSLEYITKEITNILRDRPTSDGEFLLGLMNNLLTWKDGA